jgi:hypothetical protein
MFELQNGSLVQHVSLGVGKIVALEPEAVHVFFPDGDKRFAAKLRLPAARPMLRTEGVEPNRWLEGLTAFALDAESGRYALSSAWLTHEQAVAQLLAAFPEGFADPGYQAAGKGRAGRWRAAQAAWTKRMGKGELEKLVEEGDVEGFVARAREIDGKVAALHPPADEDAVAEALADEETARPFMLALAELVAVPSPGKARFDRLFAAARSLPGEPSHQWLVATLFPFLAAPERHALIRPRTTFVGAERLGCDVRAEPAPNWATYAATRAVEGQLLERLAPQGAKDLVDVEAFLYVTATARRSAPRPTAKAAAGKATAKRAR